VAGHEILHEAGRGGSGVVYAARHLRLDVVRALKILDVRDSHDSTFRVRFARESQLAASFEHPNVVPVYEAGEVDGSPYLSMRFVDGANLAQVLASEGRLSPDRTCTLLRQVGAALDAAHERGLVHRDVKPANILIERDGETERVFLGDFGLSRLVTSASRVTASSEMLGTVNYVAPEQISGTDVDRRADVYSLACVAYECLVGEPPFMRETQLATMFAQANDPRPSPSARRPDLSRALDSVFARALAIARSERPDTASGFVDELIGALSGQSAHRWPPARPLRAGGLATVALASILAVIALTVVVTSREPAREPAPSTDRSDASTGTGPPTARPAATIELSATPTDLALGALNLWATSSPGRSLTPVVPASGDDPASPIPVDGAPSAVITGFGSVWMVDAASGDVIRSDPGEELFPTRVAVGGRPSDLAPSTTHMWVLGRRADAASLIDPTTNSVTRAVPTGDAPAAIGIGEGGVWIANAGDGTISHLEPLFGRRRGPPIAVGGRPAALAVGEAGVWVVDSARQQVIRISAGSGQIGPAIDVGGVPAAITTGFGYAWVALREGSVQRIDPAELRAVGDPIPVGKKPTAIVAGNGYVWAASEREETVTRIAPR
jgi:YVTN family beta-propeller protein